MTATLADQPRRIEKGNNAVAAIITRVGDFCVRRRWLVLGLWLVVLVLAVGGAARFAEPLSSELTVSGLPSTQTLDKVDSEFGTGGDGGKVVFAAPAGSKLTAADKSAVTALARALDTVPGVKGAASAPPTYSTNGRIGYLSVGLTDSPATKATMDGVSAAMKQARTAGLVVEASSELSTTAESSSSSGIGVLIALVILLVTFGSLVAAGLSLVTAVLGLGISIEVIHAITAVVALTSIAPTLAILLGLAVGIDYSLFLVNRHRQQLLAGAPDVRASIVLATRTAGSAVFFAALTVIIALAGLAVVRIGFLTQMGLAAAIAVLFAMLVALTLTPALLSFAGMRVLSRRTRRRLAAGTLPEPKPRARNWAGFIVRHRIAAVIVSVLILGALAVPVLSMRLDLPNDGNDPAGATDRKAYDLITDGFGPGANGPLLVLAEYTNPPSAADEASLAEQLGAVPDVRAVLPAGVRGNDVLFTLLPGSGPTASATATLVQNLRELSPAPGVDLLVTGQTAVAIDISAHLLHALPLYLALVAGFAFLLLLVVFRSVLIPLKATLSFLLSLGAALGCTVAIYQWGWLSGVFGVTTPGPLLSFLPTIVIGVLFGLSMDYEMFLVSGMHEEHRRGEAAEKAVVSGFAHGAKVVTAAALIMIGVFGSGVFGGDPTTGPIAFALAAGVLVDAFLVRLVLVPAVMSLFGTAAWWLPRRLGQVVPSVDIEGRARDEEAPVPAGVG
jgi:RND superfamily putative drug exporter